MLLYASSTHLDVLAIRLLSLGVGVDEHGDVRVTEPEVGGQQALHADHIVDAAVQGRLGAWVVAPVRTHVARTEELAFMGRQ